jgi:2-oxoglutarate ferredoxin oxidoreductase subunit beta
VFNDGAWEHVRDNKEQKPQSQLLLTHGQPMLFDAGKRGIGFDRATMKPFIIDLVREPERKAEVLIHDELDPSGLMSIVLAQMEWPDFPVPLGVFKRAQRDTFDGLVVEQGKQAQQRAQPDLRKLLFSGDLWTVG